METKVFKYLESGRSRVISLVSELIAIPTVNPPGEGYEEIVCLLEKRCKKIGLKTKRFLTPRTILDKFGVKGGSKRINLIADWPVGAKKTFHISSHYDVVPATDKWSYDPFKATIKGNRIYGRGSEDMKGNIACILFAIEAIKGCGIKPRINLQFSFTPDEEIGGRTGLGYLVEKNLVKADYAMSEGYAEDYVSMGNKGVLWAEVTVKGKAAHASVPHKGVNAFERMVELAGEFKKLKERMSHRKTRFNMKDTISRSPSFVMGGLLEGGVKANVVPGIARFSIDRRLIPEEDTELAKKEIEQIVRKFNKAHRDANVSVKFSSKENPSISKKDGRFFRAVSNSIKLVTGKRPKFSLMPGATDIRYFMRKGVPSLGYSARGGESWHSDNEFVYIDSLIDTAKVYALVMSSLD